MFLVMFVLLATVISVLLVKLRQLLRTTEQEISVFRKEICYIMMILTTFAVAYLWRWIWDADYMKQSNWNFVTYYSTQMLNFLLFDFVPLACLLFLHYRNFSEQ